MLKLAQKIEIKSLSKAWGVSRKAVRSRLAGSRDLTVREVGAIADLVGVDLLLDALNSSSEYVCGTKS